MNHYIAKFEGRDESDEVGRSVSAAGDVNGDGGASGYVGFACEAGGCSSAGESYVVFRRTAAR